MNRDKDVAGMRMAAIAEAVTDDVMAATDEQILAEAVDEGVEPASVAEQMRSTTLARLRKIKRSRLEKARTIYQQEPKGPPAKVRPSLDEMRNRVMDLIRGGAGGDLSLAFRNGKELTNSDLEGLWDDLQELGLLDDDKPND
ncbi:MAG: hypothetical protein A3H93_07395 [Rhodocyclales bacterium RIFCSPLOWO2_02_FULL_63_24]|nr:MAG: hypothetical protein A3H93_07395 [Rhodocyclales bacterium RIFCSPLOWO2_02_FULL_63_24]